MRWHRAILLVPFLAVQYPGAALAGPVEQFVQLAVHPSNPNVMAVRYVNGGGGAFVTTDGGKNWKLLCDSFALPLSAVAPVMVIADDGTSIIGTFAGMWHDDGHDCSWTEEAQYQTQWLRAFAIDPTDSTVTYAMTAAGGQQNGLLRRSANGAWADFGTKVGLGLDELVVVPHGTGRRFYVGATDGVLPQSDGGPPLANYVVRVSDDDGATWTPHPYGVAGRVQSTSLVLEAADPTNPDRIVAALSRPEGSAPPDQTKDTVLVSDDQGASFKQYLTITDIGGVAFAPDGRLWIGDAGSPTDPNQGPGGLWAASSAAATPTELSSAYAVGCVSYQSATDTLYACQPATRAPIFGSVDTKSGAFTTSLDMRTVQDFVECAGVDMAATCEEQECGAYCGYGHFAQAPICCAYDTPLYCGPSTAPVPTSCPKSRDAGLDGGNPGPKDGGPDGSIDASTGAAPSRSDAGSRDAGHPSGSGGVDGGTLQFGDGANSGTTHGSNSGCCAVAGRHRSDTDSGAAIALVTTALVLRRRRRRPQGGGHGERVGSNSQQSTY